MYQYKIEDLVEITASGLERFVQGKEIFKKGDLVIVKTKNPHAVEIKSGDSALYINNSKIKLYMPARVEKDDLVNTYYNVKDLDDEFIQEFCIFAASTIHIPDAYIVNEIADNICSHSGDIAHICIDDAQLHLKLKSSEYDLSAYEYQEIDPFLRYCGFEDKDWKSDGHKDPLEACICLKERSLLSVTLGFHNSNCPLYKGR